MIQSMLLVPAVAAMAGCAIGQSAARQDGEPPNMPSEPVAIFERSESAEQDVTPAPAAPAERTEQRAAVSHPKPAPPLAAATVVGVTEHEAMKLFGTPRVIADRPPALIWEYTGARCELALHFYMDVNTETYRVLTYDIAPKTAEESSCFTSIRDGSG
jgi:hypothetical protein